MIEVRHYVSRAGKDVFDDWLTHLADARTQAKIASRINRLAAGNFGDKRRQSSEIERALQYLRDYKERAGTA